MPILWLSRRDQMGHAMWSPELANTPSGSRSKLRELRQRARSACFGPVTAMEKADFLAVIENNRDFPSSPEMSGSPTIYVHIPDQRKM